jgi:hypothetical protein
VAFNCNRRIEDRIIEHELQVATEQMAQAERLFREASGVHNALEWSAAVGWPTPFRVEQSRAADLIVIGREDKKARDFEPEEDTVNNFVKAAAVQS